MKKRIVQEEKDSDLIIKSLNNPYSYLPGIDYDYNTTKCNCGESYCSCGKIINAIVRSVDLNAITKHLTSKVSDPFSAYCVNRLLVINKLFNFNNWRVNIVSGYYGEEVRGAILNSNCQNDLICHFKELDNLNAVDKIKKILEFEYGFLLESLKPCTAVKIITVPISKIKPFNQDYSRKVSKKDVSFYLECDAPRAVCTKAGDTYAVIDGYHRMTAAIQQQLKKVTIIVLE